MHPFTDRLAAYYRQKLWSTIPLCPADFMAELGRHPVEEWEGLLAVIQQRTDYQGLEQAAVFGQLAAKISEALPPNILVGSVGFDGPGRTVTDYIQDYYAKHERDEDTTRRMYVAVYRLAPFWPMINSLHINLTIPRSLRTQHHHIIGAPGSGKTECIKNMIWDDINNSDSVIVIDGQGDLIRDIVAVAPLDRVILIDPTDVEYPVAINVFDIGQSEFHNISATERERAINAATSVFNFVFAFLLGAELTSRQKTVFEFVTRLMIEIPDATIKTMMSVLQPDGHVQYQKYIDRLGDTAQRFFRTEYGQRDYLETRSQVVTRLLRLTGNKTFENLFSNPRSKISLNREMAQGKIILINTAKDFLFEENHRMYGRFFIALIAQAVQQRAMTTVRPRAYVYVDECHEYFDRSLGQLLEQARKYEVGLVLAHQFMSQVEGGLRDALLSIPAIRFVSSVDYGDALALARNMKARPEEIQAVGRGEFLANFRDKGTVKWSVELGKMAKLPQATPEQMAAMQDYTRARYCTKTYTPAPPPRVDVDGDGTQRSKW